MGLQSIQKRFCKVRSRCTSNSTGGSSKSDTSIKKAVSSARGKATMSEQHELLSRQEFIRKGHISIFSGGKMVTTSITIEKKDCNLDSVVKRRINLRINRFDIFIHPIISTHIIDLVSGVDTHLNVSQLPY